MTSSSLRITRDKMINICLLIFLFSFSILLMSSTFTASNHKIHIDSKLWSDFGAHIPLIRSFSLGDNFPTQYPTFPGEPIRYHYLFYLVVGIMEKIGVNIAIALNLLSAFGFTLLLYMIVKISALLFSSVKTGLLAIVLFLFNGSFSFIQHFKNYNSVWQAILDIPKITQFPSFGPWDGEIVSAFWNLNIYTNQRHLAMGFGLSLVIIWIILSSIISEKSPSRLQLIFGAIILLVLPALHQASFFITLSTGTMLIILNLRQKYTQLKSFLVLLLALIPGLTYVFSLQGSHIAIDPGFLSPSNSAFDLIHYWFFNLGIYLILTPIIFLVSNRLQKKVLISVLPLFIIANIFRLSPDMINNHKLINYLMIFIVILTAGQLMRFWHKKNIYKPLIIVLIFFLTFSGIIDIFPVFNDHTISIDDVYANQTSNWIVTNTPKDSVFLTTTYLYNPTLLAGRKNYTDYGYFNWSLGYDDATRKAKLPFFFTSNANPSQVCTNLIQANINYVMISSGQGEIPNVDPHQSVVAKEFIPEKIPDNEYQIYSTKKNCSFI